MRTWEEGVADAITQVEMSTRKVLRRVGRTPAEVRAIIETVDEIKNDLQLIQRSDQDR